MSASMPCPWRIEVRVSLVHPWRTYGVYSEIETAVRVWRELSKAKTGNLCRVRAN